MPFEVGSLPVDFPMAVLFDVGGLRHRGFHCLFWVSPVRAYLEDLHTLVVDPIAEIQSRSDVDRWPAFLQELIQLPFTALYFKFTDRH